jgi:cation:H+ antiporter|tara:strand:+ start:282 stop:1226 length:945 start_codon:yes stop_codon:yes gene_type:complete
VTIAWIFLGFILLAIGGRFILRSAIAISLRFNISKVVIGMTVVAFATSLPELLVSLKAAIIGSSSIAMNNVIGSNIANIGLVLGLTALIGNIGVPKSFYKTIWPLMFFLSLLLYWFIFNDNFLSRYEGLTLFICLVIFLIFSVKNTPNNIITKNEAFENLQYTSSIKIVIWILISSLSLYYGAEWLVFGAIALASSTGISEAVISVTVIAVGTSIPEIATSIIAIGKNQKGISIGNLIGSNIFNIGSVLGLTSIIKPILIDDLNILNRDILFLIVFTFLVLIISVLPKKSIITKLKGFILVTFYSVYLIYLFFY